MAEESLKNKAVKGTAWSAVDAFLGQGVTFIVGLILARLLSPSEYGLIGICVIVNSILEGFVDSGFSTALIRKKDASNDDYNTMFIVNLFISGVLYIALYFSTPWISSFFERSELLSLIRVTGLVVIIQGFSLTQNTILTKRIDFKTKTKASVISSVLSGIIGISMACYDYGVWALVGQLVTRQLINTICLWCFNNWRPNISFSLSSLKYLWGFGWKMMVSGLLDRIWAEAYQTVVAKFYNPATLGQYTRSKEYAALLSRNFNAVVMRVSYPVLADIQDDQQRMVAAYRKIIKMTMFVTSICMILLGAVAEPLIFTLIGEKWQMAASFLPFICVSMSFYPLHAINLNMLKVMGRSDLFLLFEIIKKVVAIFPICIGIFVGIYWMLIASICAGLINFFINSWYTGKKLKYTSWMQLRDIAPSYGIGILIAVMIYFIKYLSCPYYVILLLQILLAMVIFFVLCENIFKPIEYYELKNIAIKILGTIKHRITN